MPRFSWVLALVLLTATPHALQRAGFVPGGLDPAKARLLGVAGAVLPPFGTLGPYADMDGDGDVDLLHSLHGQVSLHVNDGFGVFRRQRPVSVADERRVAFFDADGDGRLDLLARTHFYLGTSSGDFSDATPDLPAGLIVDAGVLVDFDGDADIDVLAFQHFKNPVPGRVRLALNDGAGHFSEGTLPTTPFTPTSAAAADVDGDLDLDVVVVGGNVELWRNDGSGAFMRDTAAIPASFGGAPVLLEDLDGDADPDLVTSTGLGLNDGSGSFTAAPLPQPPQARITAAILALDREGDGDPDLVFLDSWAWEQVVYGPSPGERLLENAGAAVFTASGALPAFTGSDKGGFAGDLDGDGDDDLLVENSDSHSSGLASYVPHRQANRIFWNDGAGSFALSPMSAGEGATGDLNGDGLVDGFSVYGLALNGPPGMFTLTSSSLPPPLYNCNYDQLVVYSALGDVDGDGDADAFSAVRQNTSYCEYDNLLWINDGAAGFTDESSTRVPHAAATEDPGIVWDAFLLALDGDGDLDAACVRASDDDGSGTSSCYVNDGTGVFTFKERIGDPTFAGTFGDFDSDGDQDFLEGCNFIYHANRLFTNDGTAHFAERVGAFPAHTSNVGVVDVVPGDIDADGDLDAYVSVSFSSPFSPGPFFLYVNDGSAHFADHPERLPERVRTGAFVDLDLDGDADLLGQDGSGTSRLFLNDGRGSFEEASERIDPRATAWVDLDLDGDADSFRERGLLRHLESLGEPRIGKRHTFVVHGPAHTPFVLRQSLGSAQINMGSSGWLLIDPNQIVSIDGGRLDRDGEARVRFFVPHIPALIGFTTYWQAVVGMPLHATNLAVTTFSGL